MIAALKLINFSKVFPMGILNAIFFFATIYCFTKPNDDSTSFIISLVAGLLSFIAFIFFFVVTHRAMATEMIAEIYDEETYSYKELFDDAKQYLVLYFGMTLVLCMMYLLIIPAIGSNAGGIFQVSPFGFDFNILTLIINMFCMAWFFLGLAQISTIGANFIETFKYTFSFIFNNFAKTIIFFLLLVFVLFIFNFTLLVTAGGSQLMMMPIKVLVFAYLFNFLNAYAIDFFLNNISQDDLEE